MKNNVRFDSQVITSLAPFLDSAILSRLVRTSLMKDKGTAPPAETLLESEAEVATEPNLGNTPDLVRAGQIQIARVDENSSTELESLADALRQPGLSNEDRQSVAIRIAELAHREAQRALD